MDQNHCVRKSYYMIRNRFNNLVIDIVNGGTNAGAEVTAWLGKNWSDQLWYDDPETGTIRWKRTEFCMELKDDDDVVVMSPYRQGNPNQLWTRDGPLIRNGRDPSLVICIAENEVMPGARAIAQKQNIRLNQEFDFNQVPGLDEPYVRRNFFIVSVMNSKVLDVERERSVSGTNVILYQKKKTSAKNQLWYFDRQGIIHSALNDYVIETRHGGPATIVPYSRSLSQEWTMVESGILSSTGECLEIHQSEQFDGTTVRSSKYYDTINQRWRLEFPRN